MQDHSRRWQPTKTNVRWDRRREARGVDKLKLGISTETTPHQLLSPSLMSKSQLTTTSGEGGGLEIDRLTLNLLLRGG